VLVTHQLQCLRDADHIIIMNAGKVENQGSREDIKKIKNNFLNPESNAEQKYNSVNEDEINEKRVKKAFFIKNFSSLTFS
jgi:ABC-type bacteriocin/lantibiotic exporter with double-glycine peptidase domain